MNIKNKLQTETNPTKILSLVHTLATKDDNDSFVVEYLLANYQKLDTFTVVKMCSTVTMYRQNLDPILKEKIKNILNYVLSKEFTVHQSYKEKWHKDNYTEASIRFHIQSSFDYIKGYRLLDKVREFDKAMMLGDCFNGVIFKKIVDIIKNDLGHILIKKTDLITDGGLFTFKKDEYIFDLHYDDYCGICLRSTNKKASRDYYNKLEIIASEILAKVKLALSEFL